jgi:endonuclease III
VKTPVETRLILHKLEAQHPDADTELHYHTAFELLVATILSAQSTDQRVNMVTPALFRRYPDARALAKATTDALEPQIHSTGFFRAKSKALVGMAQALVAQHGGEVPAEMEALTALPGVGRKTANVVLGHAPHRDCRIGRARCRRAAALRRGAAGALDADFGHAHPARTTDLQAQTSLRAVRRPGRLPVFQHECCGRESACGTKGAWAATGT